MAASRARLLLVFTGRSERAKYDNSTFTILCNDEINLRHAGHVLLDTARNRPKIERETGRNYEKIIDVITHARRIGIRCSAIGSECRYYRHHGAAGQMADRQGA